MAVKNEFFLMLYYAMVSQKTYHLQEEFMQILNIWYKRLYKQIFGYKIKVLPDVSGILKILNDMKTAIITTDDAIAFIANTHKSKDYAFADSMVICAIIHIISWSLLMPAQPMVDYVIKNYNFNLELGLNSASIVAN